MDQIRVEDLRYTKVQELRVAVLVDEDVARLDITVDDLAFMGVLDCRTNLLKELKAAHEIETLAVRVVVKRLPLDVLHHKIWDTVGQGASIKQTGYIWVFEGGEDLAFVPKSPYDKFRVHP